MRRILIVNGPNLNLLGTRRPDLYGTTTLRDLEAQCGRWAAAHDLAVEFFQSNHEGAIIDRLHEARGSADGIVINPGALTHSSYSLHDAIEAVDLPAVEVHISNIKEREPWRAHSLTSPACVHSIYGRGVDGYRWAIEHLTHRWAMPFTTLAYAAGDDHVGDLRLPDGKGPHPVAVLIHGGFWRHHWTRDTTEALAVNLVEHGFATWNVEYRRVGMGGGFPNTLQDVAASIDHVDVLAAEYRLDLSDVVVLGHSAGGQLALWAASRHQLADDDPGANPRVAPGMAVSLAGVTNLEQAEASNLGDGAAGAFLGKAPREAAYRVASPSHRLPADRPHVVVHGTDDDRVPNQFSRSYAEAGAPSVELIEVEGADHFDPIDPTTAAWKAVVQRLAER